GRDVGHGRPVPAFSRCLRPGGRAAFPRHPVKNADPSQCPLLPGRVSWSRVAAPTSIQREGRRVAPIIHVEELRKTYPGGVEAVRGLSFQVEEGEIFGFLGPNGAGKSTTIMMLTTLLRPTSGSMRVVGLDPTVNPFA